MSCVAESLDIGENFACSNAMNFQLAKIGAVADPSLEKRGKVQECNECRNSHDVCILVATSSTEHDACNINRDICYKPSNCIGK